MLCKQHYEKMIAKLKVKKARLNAQIQGAKNG